MIAVANPEFHGDILWSIPAARELARRHGCQADFFLAPKSERIADLLRAQSFIRTTVVDRRYTEPPIGEDHNLTVEGNYEAVYQIGFRHGVPIDCTLLDYFCKIANLPRQGHWLDLPEPNEPVPKGPFVVLAAKKHDLTMHLRWGDMWRDFVRRCPLPVVEVGVPGTATAVECGAIDRLRHGFLEMACIIAKCKYFFGHISGPLVIADAMPNVVRVAVHDGGSWVMEHVTKSGMNHYPVCYDADPLLRYIG